MRFTVQRPLDNDDDDVASTTSSVGTTTAGTEHSSPAAGCPATSSTPRRTSTASTDNLLLGAKSVEERLQLETLAAEHRRPEHDDDRLSERVRCVHTFTPS